MDVAGCAQRTACWYRRLHYERWESLRLRFILAELGLLSLEPLGLPSLGLSQLVPISVAVALVGVVAGLTPGPAVLSRWYARA